MKIRLTATLVSLLCLAAVPTPEASAQEYSATQVTVSKEKVRRDGKIYLSHVVLERQTLYSICKAYGVTLQEVYDANKALNLETEGLKKDQILFIPFKEDSVQEAPAEDVSRTGQTPGQQVKSSAVQESDYFIHRVKWFEDLETIARKYSVSKESIMNINGMTSEKVRRKDELKIPRDSKKWETLKAETEKTDAKPEAALDSTAKDSKSNEGIFERIFPKKEKHGVRIAVLMPFKASNNPDGQMLDFYSGALLAARHLGKDNDITLNTYDAYLASSYSADELGKNDFIIGPVSCTDILRAAGAAGNSWVVSPLDQRAEAIADTVRNVIQAPSSVTSQIKDMISWIEGDTRSGDKTIVFTQKGASTAGYAGKVLNEVSRSGISHGSISFNILEGRQMMGKLEGMMTGSGTNRIVIASDNKAFVIEVVRLLYLLSSQNKDIVLYGTAKTRTFDEIDIEQLHALKLHASVSYYVDYTSKDVQQFLKEYRALFNAEPSRSAFQGYDLMKYFSTVDAEYGNGIEQAGTLPSARGLQSDIRLTRTTRGGFVNGAVRRIVYGTDYSITLAGAEQ